MDDHRQLAVVRDTERNPRRLTAEPEPERNEIGERLLCFSRTVNHVTTTLLS